ncbi:MAG: hypothetical protein IKC01_08700 [Clostridia bacterium]|nr:hypothetical protein [Clostridia bacterium]
MFKKYTNLIFIIILVIQLTFPLGFLFYRIHLNNLLDKETEIVKLNIEEIYIYDGKIGFDTNLNELYKYEEYYNFSHIIFAPSKNGEYSKISVSNLSPETNTYINKKTLNDFYSITLDGYEQVNDVSYENLYSKSGELHNVARGVFPGPLTEAYAILKIYKNQYKVVEIYIGERTLTEYIESYKNNKAELSRFDYSIYEFYNDSSDVTIDDYIKVIDKNDLYLYEHILDEYKQEFNFTDKITEVLK